MEGGKRIRRYGTIGFRLRPLSYPFYDGASEHRRAGGACSYARYSPVARIAERAKDGLLSGSQRALAQLASRERLAKNARSSRPAVEPMRHCGAAGPSIFSGCSLPAGGVFVHQRDSAAFPTSRPAAVFITCAI